MENFEGIARHFTRLSMDTIKNLLSYFGGQAEILPRVIELIDVLAKVSGNYQIIYAAFHPMIALCFNALQTYFTQHASLAKLK